MCSCVLSWRCCPPTAVLGGPEVGCCPGDQGKCLETVTVGPHGLSLASSSRQVRAGDSGQEKPALGAALPSRGVRLCCTEQITYGQHPKGKKEEGSVAPSATEGLMGSEGGEGQGEGRRRGQ